MSASYSIPDSDDTITHSKKGCVFILLIIVNVNVMIDNFHLFIICFFVLGVGIGHSGLLFKFCKVFT